MKEELPLVGIDEELLNILDKEGLYHLILALSYNVEEEILEIIHICSYETAPTDVVINNLEKELSEDEEFNMTELVRGDNYVFVKATIEDIRTGEVSFKPEDVISKPTLH